MLLDDTIAAVSSADGPALRGIVRLSGSRAVAITQELVRDDAGAAWEGDTSWRLWEGRVILDEGFEVPAGVLFFRGPDSYTTEDLVELHVPGNPVLVRLILERVLAMGARGAEPGEFTARAFFHGRLDLTQAEAVAELIHAQSDGQLRAAHQLLDGALRAVCGEVMADLAEVLALVEAGIDFSEEDITFASAEELTVMTGRAAERLGDLLAHSQSWENLEHLPRVVLAGWANAGKSSLANSLLGMDRSIVSSLAGTTRDVVTAPLKLADGECLLADTAGLGEVDDDLAELTQERSRRAMAGAELILWVFDAGAGGDVETIELGEKAGVIWVGNKSDVVGKDAAGAAAARLAEEAGRGDSCGVSAVTGEGLAELKVLMNERLHLRNEQRGERGAVALTARQRRHLVEALGGVERAEVLVKDGGAAEFVALELRGALDELGHIGGQLLPDEILGKIFSQFCVGK